MSRYFVYIHEKNRKMVITDEDGVHITTQISIPESTSLRGTVLDNLRDLGWRPISKWSSFSHYSFAEVKKE